MIRVLLLLWTLALSLIVTGISFFYVRGEAHGFPLAFAREVAGQGGGSFKFNVWSAALDVIFWWLLFSILWVILKNYIFEA